MPESMYSEEEVESMLRARDRAEDKLIYQIREKDQEIEMLKLQVADLQHRLTMERGQEGP